MYWHSMSGWDWLWGSLMMGFWILLVGAVVYVAVRLASSERGRRSRP